MTIQDFFKQSLNIDLNKESDRVQFIFDIIEYFLTKDLDTIISDLDYLLKLLKSWKSNPFIQTIYNKELTMLEDKLNDIVNYFDIFNNEYKKILMTSTISSTANVNENKSIQFKKYMLEKLKMDLQLAEIFIIKESNKPKIETLLDQVVYDIIKEQDEDVETGISDNETDDTVETNYEIAQDEEPNINIKSSGISLGDTDDEELQSQIDDTEEPLPVEIDDDKINKILQKSPFYDIYLTELNFDFEHIKHIVEIILQMIKIYVNISNFNTKKLIL